jgi:hypothetical protein
MPAHKAIAFGDRAAKSAGVSGPNKVTTRRKLQPNCCATRPAQPERERLAAATAVAASALCPTCAEAARTLSGLAGVKHEDLTQSRFSGKPDDTVRTNRLCKLINLCMQAITVDDVFKEVTGIYDSLKRTTFGN